LFGKKIILAVLLITISTMIMASETTKLKGDLSTQDIDVFFGKEISAVDGKYMAVFTPGNQFGKLKATTISSDGSTDSLEVGWSAVKPGYGVVVTQDDEFALKLTTNAKVVLNGVESFGRVFVHYSKLGNNFVVRGRGFRFQVDFSA